MEHLSEGQFVDEAQGCQLVEAGKRVAVFDLAELAGRERQAREILARLNLESAADRVSVAVVYAALGNADEAFRWLERAYAERDSGVSALKVNPGFDPLRSDPRSQSLLRRMNFAE